MNKKGDTSAATPIKNAVLLDVTLCGSCKNQHCRNVGSCKSHTASHYRRQHSSVTAVKTANIKITPLILQNDSE
jgi:hypothetical protein